MEITFVAHFTEVIGSVMMAKGKRATPRQAAAGRRNAVKAQVSRIGLRGQRYKTRLRPY